MSDCHRLADRRPCAVVLGQVARLEEFGEPDHARRTDARLPSFPADCEPGRPDRRLDLESRESRTAATEASQLHRKPPQAPLAIRSTGPVDSGQTSHRRRCAVVWRSRTQPVAESVHTRAAQVKPRFVTALRQVTVLELKPGWS